MTISIALSFASACTGAVLAVATAVRAGKVASRWAFVVGMAALGAEAACAGFSESARSAGVGFGWLEWRMVAMSFLPSTWLLFGLTYVRGNARAYVGMWRWLIVGSFVVPVGLALGLRHRLIAAVPLAENIWRIRLLAPGIALHLVVLLASVLILMQLERTFRASVGTMRWRIKFMILAVGLIFGVRVYTTTQELLFATVDLSLFGLNSAALMVGALLMLRSFFRTGHFNLDVYPSQSVLQNSITIIVVGTYLLVVGVLAKFVAYFGGDSAFGLKAFLVMVALVLLAVLVQSDRMRLKVRQFVSRHFQRPLYDYRTAWKKFAEATASRVEQTDLCRSVVTLMADMFQALSVSIWLVDEKKEGLTLVASTSISGSTPGSLVLRSSEITELRQWFEAHSEPVDIDSSPHPWAVALRKNQPSEFPNGGDRICIPLIGRGDFLGIIVVGDRVSGMPFSLQDFDLLKCVGDHTAGSVMNAQLSRKLVQAKELEAFQTMATFFVHDLKNAASTLHLMLQNLPVHFNDPVFREDALRGVAKSVTHINRLVGRLGLLRKQLSIVPAAVSLNDIVNESVRDLEKNGGVQVSKDLGELPPLMLDAEQISKVVTNLVFNAREAMGGAGEIKIETRQDNGSVQLSVTDHGSGMSPEFLRNSLFRPFQTTKATGLGIGMFQSKMILEAHGARINVTSEQGRGTTFQIFFPVTQLAK